MRLPSPGLPWNPTRWVGRLLALSLVLAAGSAFAEPLRVQPHWVPQSQFAGFYVAADQGWYRDAGLDVDILPHGPDYPASEALARGEADIALLYLVQALELRDAGVEVVNVAQLLHDSSLVIVSFADRDILAPEDLDGRRVARWQSFRMQPEALFRAYGVEPEIIDQGSGVTALRSGAVDAAMATRFNEMVELYLSGFEPEELSTIGLEEHGTGLAEDGIYVLESTLEERPEAVKAFVAASLRGWQHAFEHPEHAVDAVMERVQQHGEPTNRAHQSLMLKVLRSLYFDSDGRLPAPVLDPTDYLMAHNLMNNLVSLEREPVDYDTFHRPVIDARPE